MLLARCSRLKNTHIRICSYCFFAHIETTMRAYVDPRYFLMFSTSLYAPIFRPDSDDDDVQFIETTYNKSSRTIIDNLKQKLPPNLR